MVSYPKAIEEKFELFKRVESRQLPRANQRRQDAKAGAKENAL